jgi:hypothetical protein
MFRIAAASGFALAALVGLFFAIPAWLDRPKTYDQSSPDAVVNSLAEMLETGDVARMHELVYAEDEPMRQALARLGTLLDELRLLGLTVNERFPQDIETLRRDAEDAARRGEATGLVARLAQNATGQRRNKNRGRRSNSGDAFNLAIRQLLASPYESLDEARAKLSTIEISEDTAGVLWEGQTVMPPFGLVMRKDERDSNWYLVLPLDLPVLAKYRPRTPEQWAIAGHLMRAWANAARDLRRMTETGSIQSLDQLASESFGMIGPPTLMIGAAYSKQFEDQDDKEPKPEATSDSGG